MLLTQVSQGNGLTRGVIGVMQEEMPILDILEFMNTAAEAVQYKQTPGQSAGGEYRTKGSEYSTPKDRNISQGSTGVVLFGEQSTIDKFDKQTHNNIPQLRSARINQAARDVAIGFVNELFNGAGPGSNELTGFVNLVDSSYSINADTNGLAIRTNTDTFFELLNEHLWNESYQGMSMNKQLYAFLVNEAGKRHALTWDKNEFGVPVASYDGIPFYPVTNTAIPNTETVGTSNDCTSLYFFRVGELRDVTIHTTMGVEVTDYEAAPGSVIEKALVEFYGQSVMYNQDAIKRLAGLRLA